MTLKRAFRAIKAVPRIWCSLLLVALCLPFGSQVVAQSNSEPLRVSFLPIPPFAMYGPDGEKTGFLIELARLISTEIGVPIDIIDVPDTEAFVQAQINGSTDIIAGIAQLPVLSGTSLFSDPVATDQLRLTVLDDHPQGTGPITNQRLGIVPPALGAEERALLDQNQPVEFDSPDAAVMALLIGNVDALLIPEPVAYSLARLAGAGGRIRFIGEPLRIVDRAVALHESRADLLGPINAAIARLEADGRLEALRIQFNVQVPAPPPDILTVGFSEFPPYKFIGQDGEPTGFSVDVLRELMERAGLEFTFKPISQQQWQDGPRLGEFDMITLTNIGPERAATMDLTLPILETRISIFTRTGLAGGITGLDDLTRVAVGVVENHLGQSLAQAHGGLSLTTYGSGRALLAGLLRDEIGAAVFTSNNLLALAEDQGKRDEIAEALPPFHVTRAAPGLRFGLGSIRDRLNVVIPGYLVSPEYAALREKYFGEPVFWTRARVMLTLGGIAALVLVILAAVALLYLRARARRAAEVSLIRDELETVLNATSSGIIALNAQGQIERINAPARQILGDVKDKVPFDWPTHIQFLDGETLEPLEASADPLRRAVSGHVIRHQTHLISSNRPDETQRYVRINSTKLASGNQNIVSVFVMEDISVEERNRQVVERRSRLDALGQLTGGIAHDFNNLLASQLYAIDLAAKAKTPEKRGYFLEIAKNSIQKGRALTSRLLAFARKQPGLATSRPASVVFGEFEKLIRPILEAHLEFSFSVDDPNLHVFCDQTQLESALMNLVLNSRDAILRSGQGSRIDLRARAVRSVDGSTKSDDLPTDSRQTPIPDGHILRFVEVLVSDNGPGMDPETLSRSTDPFFTTKDSNSGTGLGLAMVYGFVRQSDGDFRIYTEEGVGTTVRMVLPRGSEEGVRERAVLDEPAQRGNGETILVVEDEEPLLMIMTDVLHDLGYKVQSAKSGQEALDLIATGVKIDVLLSDVVMPGAIGGFELARQIRELHPELPVIYTSGYTGFTASEMGSVQAKLLQKPATPAELSEAIRQALSDSAMG